MRASVYFSKCLNYLIGDPKVTSLEHRIFNTISLINGSLNLFATLSVVYLGNAVIVFLANFISGTVLLGMYYLSRFKNFYQALYWPFNITILLYLSSLWFFNSGTLGGNHYYFIPALVIAIVMIQNQSLWFVYLIYIEASFGLLVLEYFHEDWLSGQETRMDRYIDLAVNFIFVQIFTSWIILILRKNLNIERKKSDDLLLSILPESIAEELKRTERVIPVRHESISILFTDMAGFTKLAETMSPEDLVESLDACFRKFDELVAKHKMEKIKTIGDAYMAAGGIPKSNSTHAIDAVLCGLEMQEFMGNLEDSKLMKNEHIWELRLGIHSGPAVAGVVGSQKFVYDIWGDSVNTASRLESSGIVGQVNISQSTYDLVTDFFDCSYRGKVSAKNKGEMDMYYVLGIKKDLRESSDSFIPNSVFWEKYGKLS